MQNEFQVVVNYEVTPDIICSLFVSAFEGGSTYWMQSADLLTKHEPKPGKYFHESEVIWWGRDSVYAEDFRIELGFDDPNHEDGEGNGAGRKVITPDDLQRGLQLMANNYPEHFNSIRTENMDAETGDVLLQCILFGEIVYD